MADKKISDLNSLNVVQGLDLFVIVDIDQTETKNITKSNFMGSPGPIGVSNPNTASFTTLGLSTGVSVNRILDEDDMSSDSNVALATQQSIKAYVDSQISGVDEHNELSGIQGGDSTNRYHLTLTEYNGLTDGGSTSLHTHAHNDLNDLQGGDSTAIEFYHLTQEIHDQLDSTPSTVIFSNGIDVKGHSQIGDGDVDYPGWPTTETMLNVNETFGTGVTDEATGVYVSIENLAVGPFAIATGVAGVVQNNTSTQHSQLIGVGGFASLAADGGSVDDDIIGVNGTGAVVASNTTVTNLMGGFFSTVHAFGMSNVSITNAVGGQFQLSKWGSGSIDITNAYGALIKTPGFTSSGTTTNLYGLYIEDQSTVGFTNDYNIYSAGISSENKFEGNVTIDGTLSVDTIDSTALVITGDIYCDDLFTSGTSIHLGNIILTEDTGGLKVDKLKLQSGVQIDEVSSDTALGTSDTTVPTQNAVKTYVDTLTSGIENGNTFMSTGDTTADIIFVQEPATIDYSVGYSIINTVDDPPSLFVSGVFEKRIDGFRVMLSGPVDTDNYYISWVVTNTLLGLSESIRITDD